jgi:hypothetical protein
MAAAHDMKIFREERGQRETNSTVEEEIYAA